MNNGLDMATSAQYLMVPANKLIRVFMLLDPLPIKTGQGTMVFRNPMAAEVLTELSARLRELQKASAPLLASPVARTFMMTYSWSPSGMLKDVGCGAYIELADFQRAADEAYRLLLERDTLRAQLADMSEAATSLIATVEVHSARHVEHG